jgi:hypothetical protein
MKTRRNRSSKKKGGKRTRYIRAGKAGVKWVTAIEAANKTLGKTGSVEAARESLRKQALTNARRLFGSIGAV